MDVQQINLEEIHVEHTQTRSQVRQKAVDDYATLISSEVEMYPATVFEVDGVKHLAAGHHRYAAYQKAGKKCMPCFVMSGSLWDAIKFGIQDNLKHQGERLTTADKVHSVQVVLRQKPRLSNAEIARICGCTDKTVARRRARLEATSEIPKSTVRTGRDGRPIRTDAIGNNSQASLPKEDFPNRTESTSPIPDKSLSNDTGPAADETRHNKAESPVFDLAYKQLGKLKDAIFDVDQQFPNWKNRKDAQSHARKLGEILRSWQED